MKKSNSKKILATSAISLGAILMAFALMTGLFMNSIEGANKEEVITENFITANANRVIEQILSEPRASLLFDSGDVFPIDDTDYRYRMVDENSDVVAGNAVFMGELLDETVTQYDVAKYAVIDDRRTEQGYNIIDRNTGDVIVTIDESRASDYFSAYSTMNIATVENQVPFLEFEKNGNSNNSNSGRNSRDTLYYQDVVGSLSVTGAYADTMVDSRDNYSSFADFMVGVSSFRGILFITGLISVLAGLFIALKAKAQPSKSDKLPTEVFVIGGIVILRLCISALSRQAVYFSSMVTEYTPQNIMGIIAMIVAPIVLGITAYTFINGIKNRIDGKTMKTNSLIYKAYIKISKMYQKRKANKQVKVSNCV